MPAIKKAKYNRKCAVVKCNVTNLTVPKRRFFRFPVKDEEKRSLWKSAIDRRNLDDTIWSPKKNGRICSDHFQSGSHSFSRYDTDYCPSIFPGPDNEMITVPPPLQKSKSSRKSANLEDVNLDHGRYYREF